MSDVAAMPVAAAPVLGLRFLAAFGVLAIGPSLGWDALVASGVVGDASSAAAKMEAGMAGWVATCVAIAALARWQPTAVPMARVPYRAVLRVYVPFVVPWLAFLIGYLVGMRRLGHAVPAQDALRYLAAGDVSRPGFWLVVFGITVGAPVAEEIVFRGYLQGALRCVLPRWLAIGAASAVFGLVHTWPYALPVGLLGALFGWLCERHRSLWPSMCAHATHNLLTVAITVCWPAHLDLLYPR